jgi:hypothetical protein
MVGRSLHALVPGATSVRDRRFRGEPDDGAAGKPWGKER